MAGEVCPVEKVFDPGEVRAKGGEPVARFTGRRFTGEKGVEQLFGGVAESLWKRGKVHDVVAVVHLVYRGRQDPYLVGESGRDRQDNVVA